MGAIEANPELVKKKIPALHCIWLAKTMLQLNAIAMKQIQQQQQPLGIWMAKIFTMGGLALNQLLMRLPTTTSTKDSSSGMANPPPPKAPPQPNADVDAKIATQISCNGL
ncbi:hypothetical protein ACA910_020528 [Epithemia clementina (nom. ined.)]